MTPRPAGSPTPAVPDLQLERVLDAPPELVFAAWTEARHLANWWGPHGFTNPVCEFDARVGGAIRIDMCAPDGTVHRMDGTVRAIEAPARLLLYCRALDAAGRPHLEVETEVTFAAGGRGGAGTVVRLRARVLAATADGQGAADGMAAGWAQSLERLGTEVLEAANATAERSLVLTRVFAAPPELVFRAWTEPARLLQWWGPAGFRLTTHAMRFEPGGVWRYTMHGPDGSDYENKITWLEIERPHRLVYQLGGDVDCEPVRFRVEVTFAAEGGDPRRTRVVMRSEFPSRAALQHVVREYGALEGGRQHLARLGEFLASVDAGGGAAAEAAFAITRVLRAPVDLVWAVWTQAPHLQQWFGPTGAVMSECAMDLRVGGELRYAMQVGDGTRLRGKWVFRAIEPQRQLVYAQAFTDAAGDPVRNPWDPQWPLWTLATVEFRPHAGKGAGTVVTVRWVPLDATDAECATFRRGHESMQQGWGGTFDRCVDYLRAVADSPTS